MATLVEAVASVRDAVTAVLRIHTTRPARVKKGKPQPAQFRFGLAGTAWCIVSNKLLLTAFHILNGGQPRDPGDKFYVFVVPQNGPHAYHFPVVGFPFEDQDLDFAVLEISSTPAPNLHIPALPVTFDSQPDGAHVLTYGFPSPEIGAANVDAEGNWLGGQFFLKGHANEGIVAAQYEIGGRPFYELNVGWHHGESGGPVCRLVSSVAAFAVMQHYRNIQSPHGTVAGPHRGRSLVCIESRLRQLGAQVV